MNAARRCLTLAKGHHRYVFWYQVGQETEVMASLIRMAEEANGEFDWFDAAVLSYQIGRQQTVSEADSIA